MPTGFTGAPEAVGEVWKADWYIPHCYKIPALAQLNHLLAQIPSAPTRSDVWHAGAGPADLRRFHNDLGEVVSEAELAQKQLGIFLQAVQTTAAGLQKEIGKRLSAENPSVFRKWIQKLPGFDDPLLAGGVGGGVGHDGSHSRSNSNSSGGAGSGGNGNAACGKLTDGSNASSPANKVSSDSPRDDSAPTLQPSKVALANRMRSKSMNVVSSGSLFRSPDDSSVAKPLGPEVSPIFASTGKGTSASRRVGGPRLTKSRSEKAPSSAMGGARGGARGGKSGHERLQEILSSVGSGWGGLPLTSSLSGGSVSSSGSGLRGGSLVSRSATVSGAGPALGGMMGPAGRASVIGSAGGSMSGSMSVSVIGSAGVSPRGPANERFAFSHLPQAHRLSLASQSQDSSSSDYAMSPYGGSDRGGVQAERGREQEGGSGVLQGSRVLLSPAKAAQEEKLLEMLRSTPPVRWDKPVKAFPKDDPTKAPHLTAFLGYKAGMTHIVREVEKPGSRLHKKEAAEAVTIVETPPMIVCGLVAYVKTAHGPRTLTHVYAGHLSDNVRRRWYKNWHKSKKKAFTKYAKKFSTDEGKKEIEEELERMKKHASIIRVMAHTEVHKLKGIKQKKSHLMEIQINGGTIEEKVDWGYKLFEKAVPIDAVFRKDEMIDVIAITKGHGNEGVVHRWGVTRLPRKTHRGLRKVACIGAWHPARVPYTVARAGQNGYHHRTELNKKIYKIGKKGDESHKASTEYDRTDKEITPMGGFAQYGVVGEDYIMIKGCCPGVRKRVLTLRRSLLKQTSRNALEEVKLKFIDTRKAALAGMGLVWRAAKMLDASWHELAFIHASSSTVGYRPHVRSTTLAHLIATNCGPFMLPILPIRDRIRDKVEEAFGMQLGLLVEFTGIISWLPGATIGWHADDNRPYLKQRAFAAVCYLNEYGKDFDGGLFRFRQGHPHTVAPKPGRLVAYSASGENEHCVDPVIRGQRLTLTLWFTLDPSHSEDLSLLTLLSRIPLSLHHPFPRITLNPPPTGDVGPGKGPEAGKKAEVEAVSEDRGVRQVVCGANQQHLASDGLGQTGLGELNGGASEGNEKEGSGGDGVMEREAGNEAVLVPIPLVASNSLYLVQKEGQGKLGEGEDGEVEGGEKQGGSEGGREGQGEGEVDIRIQELASMGWKAVPFLQSNCNATMQSPPGSDGAGLVKTESEWVALVPSPSPRRDETSPCLQCPVSELGKDGKKAGEVEKDVAGGKERQGHEAGTRQECIGGDYREECDSRGGGGRGDSVGEKARVLASPVVFYNILHALQACYWQEVVMGLFRHVYAADARSQAQPPGSTSGQEGEDRTSLDRIAAPFESPQGLVRSSGDAASLEDDIALANPLVGSAEASDERREVAENGGDAAGQRKKRKRQSAAGLGAGAIALPSRHLYHLPATSCNAVLVLFDAGSMSLEAVGRATEQAEVEGSTEIEGTHLERILPKLLLDF
ncbi:unnamed protein product [Closterium sp. NIES-65]|nr:unnamed protein product [Closterium sp. NIES-65]